MRPMPTPAVGSVWQQHCRELHPFHRPAWGPAETLINDRVRSSGLALSMAWLHWSSGLTHWPTLTGIGPANGQPKGSLIKKSVFVVIFVFVFQYPTSWGTTYICFWQQHNRAGFVFVLCWLCYSTLHIWHEPLYVQCSTGPKQEYYSADVDCLHVATLFF